MIIIKKNYVTLIIDIEKSKTYKIRDRNYIQRYMMLCVEQLNILFRDDIEFEVTFSAGDELQGMFLNVTSAVLYFRLLEIIMKPVQIRAGIGVGEWTVKIQEGMSTQQDGPAYHRARQAIEEAHKMQLHNVRIYSDRDDILANHLINASNSLKKLQISKQNIVLVILELLYPFITPQMSIDNNIIKILILEKLNYNKMRANRTEMRETSYNISKIPKATPIIIDGINIEAEEAIVKKYTSTVISEILGSTRQNADSIIKRGNSNKIRSLDFMALQYVEKAYGGKVWN